MAVDSRLYKYVSSQESYYDKDIIIKELKEAMASGGSRVVVPEEADPDRPKMESVFIDPLDKNAGSSLVSHITIEDVSIDEKEKMEDKAAKLRNILGGRSFSGSPKLKDK